MSETTQTGPCELSPDQLRVWRDIVDLCRDESFTSISVASKQRRAAILAVDAALPNDVGTSPSLAVSESGDK